jgi:hypothetical protein
MNISSGEAAKALQEIEASRNAMRYALRNHRGHLHLWLWGCLWVVMSLLNWKYGQEAVATNLWISGAGLVGSFAIGIAQSQKIQSPIDRRFVGVCVMLLIFGYVVWPFFFSGIPHSYKAAYGYFTVLWMEIYMVAGLWFKNNMLWFWIGLGITASIIATILFLPALFWPLCVLFGVVLVACGCYVRYA